jgi:peptidoglycan/LPS O-acetylase OafA/YrhL
LLVLASVATLAYPIALGALGLYRSQRRESLVRMLGQLAIGGGLSAVAAVLLGSTLFREPDLGRRLTAALLACAGAACLLLAR